MSLLEVMVVIAIVLVLATITVAGLGDVLALKQGEVARDLAVTYEMLHDQAVMENTTFRIAYHVDADYYEVEQGDGPTLVFNDPDQRVRWQEEQDAKLRKFTKRDLAEGEGPREQSRFQKVSDRFTRRVELPRGTRFGGVHTPQYEDMVRPSGVAEDPEQPLIVYSYVFSSGFVEQTVVQLVDAEDPTSGYTLAIEPLSGKARLLDGAVDLRDLEMDMPNPPKLVDP